MEEQLKVFVNPQTAYADERTDIMITGLITGECYELVLSAHDYYAVNTSVKNAPVGTRWESRAVYRANEEGCIDLTKQPPVGGCYQGIDGMGLFTHLSICERAGKAPVMEPEQFYRHDFI